MYKTRSKESTLTGTCFKLTGRKVKCLAIVAVPLVLFVLWEYRTPLVSSVRKIETLDVENETSFVILFSYMRSGSSFVGSILETNKEVFYMFEPLHYGHGNLCPSFRAVDVTITQKEWVSDNLEKFLQCHLSDVSPEVLTDWSHFSRYKKEGKCVQENKTAVADCFVGMQQHCARCKRRVTKLVRATMDEIHYFLSQNQNIARHTKIIHLLRDPRGRLNSFIHMGMRRLSKGLVSTVCERQMKDVRIRKQLEKQFQGMFLEIRYEDVASDPVVMANRIYRFLYSEPVPDQVKDWIQMNTNSKNTESKERKFGTFRRNSTATSLAWEKQLSGENRKLIESECKQLLSYLN